MITLQQLKDYYCSVFYLEEDMILDVIVAIAIATKLPGDAIWLLVIGGPSSGKTELLNSLNKVPFVHPVSSLTENTFLSNMRITSGKEASLLHEIGTTGMITMKDYTSILSMRPEKREIIVSQMREIYDGELTKKAGNGNSEVWKGKINWIGAVTESVYLKEDESAGMGRRTINYIMPLQNRRITTERALKNNSDIADKREKIQDLFAEYIMGHLSNLPPTLPELSDEFNERLITLADFITLVRTPTSRNYRGELILVPAPEMPMRVFQMFQTLAKILVHLHTHEQTYKIKDTALESIMKMLNRLAFDSIPKQRMLILRLLAKYEKVTSKGVAQELRYPTETTRMWLEDVNVLGICERETTSGPDIWVMNEDYRKIMIEYGGVVKETGISLTDDSETVSNNEIQPAWMVQAMKGNIDDPGLKKELNNKAQQSFNDF